MRQDFIFGLKLLFKHRAFTAAALLTLALAIAPTPPFSRSWKTWSPGSAIPQADRLVTMFNIYPAWASPTAAPTASPISWTAAR